MVLAAAAVGVAVAALAANPTANLIMENAMKFTYTLKTLASALLIATVFLAVPPAYPAPAKATPAQQVYASPEAAAKGLAEALRAQDRKAVLSVVGPASGRWLSSGDPVADRADWEEFLAAYEKRNEITPLADGRAMLLVGEDNWPFPAPLVKKEKGWVFDTAAGREEIINRRVGRNELDVIQTLLAVVDAQREYAAADLDGNGFNDYAQRFISREGRRDGLFWPTAENDPPSPLGPLIGNATREGYVKKSDNKSQAFHGYRYRILKGQGKHASGGEYDYLVKGRLLGGFAVVAYPARYGVSGVMTFMVNHDGNVFEKNLGQSTESIATKMVRFNPDSSWKKVQ